MRAGKLNQRVIVERPVRSQDSSGDEIITWAPVVTTWGEVRPATARMRERMTGNQLLAAIDTLIRLRYAPIIADIDATWRLSLGSVIYNIVGVANVNMANREFEIMCISGTNNG